MTGPYLRDSRKSFEDLCKSFDALEEAGWIKEIIAVSSQVRDGETVSLPIIAYRTPAKGEAMWVISGIHGEEPAGPNALAEGIDHIKNLGREIPMVFIPVANPLGYYSSWRYMNMKEWSKDITGHSVGDSEHVLQHFNDKSRARTDGPICPEAGALVDYVIKTAKDYPPLMSIDMHEDDLIHEGYIYAVNGNADPVAAAISSLMSQSGIALKQEGLTRFGETVSKGVVLQESDGSIDELMSSEKIVVNGQVVKGPGAKTVIVTETPAGALPLEERKRAQLSIVKNLKTLKDIALKNKTPGLKK